jgi:hypothetical protein
MVVFSDESQLAGVTRRQFAHLYAQLISVAREGRKLPYSDVEGIVGLDHHRTQDRKILGGLLGLISEAEVAQGRPMLSSVVWHNRDQTIGDGFINLAKEHAWLRPGEDEDAFARREYERTPSAWKPAGLPV